MRTKGRLDGGGHGHRAAFVVDGDHLRGGDAQRRPVRRVGNLNAWRRARFSRAHAALTDQGGAAGQITRVYQALDRNRHEVRIRHVLRAIGIGQALGFGNQVHGLRVGFNPRRRVGFYRFQRRQGVVFVACLQGLQRTEDLRHGDAARRRWRHAADLPALIVGAQWRALLGGIVLEVVQ